MNHKLAPVRLSANQPRQFYRGGEAIARFRGAGDDLATTFGPEDWVASTTTRFGKPHEGLSTLPDGTVLRDAVAADPHGWLGPAHVGSYAESTALLVKLLDAGQRLPLHFHPSNEFAREQFDSHFGKHEAWVVLGTSGDNPTVYAGFTEPQDPATVRAWVHDDPAPAMIDTLNTIPVQPGDTVYIPAGLPHAIGAGVFVAELQQPTDFSLTLEWRDFLADADSAHLGIGFDTAIEALDTSAWDSGRLDALITRTAASAEPVVDLMTPAARRYFRADRLRPGPNLTLDPSFAVLLVTAGSGTLRTEHAGEYTLTAGETYVLPHGCGETELAGDDLAVVRARPPAP